jgi:hypothetical protein
MKPVYSVEVKREGKWWIGVVPVIKGAATEVKQLSELEIEVRDLIAGLLDVDEDNFDLDWDMSAVLGSKGQATWNAYRRERDQLEECRSRYEADRLSVLQALKSSGVSVRDSAALVAYPISVWHNCLPHNRYRCGFDWLNLRWLATRKLGQS